MRLSTVPAVFALLLVFAEFSSAFPPVVAEFILGRPVTENSVKKQVGSVTGFIDPLVEGTDAITKAKYSVGDPAVKLSVLVVEPRRYGFTVEEKITIIEKKELSYSLSMNVDDVSQSGSTRETFDKVLAEAKEKGQEKNLTEKQITQLLRAQAHAGGAIPSTENPRTVFLILGYGVPKKLGMPMALLLANHGIRSVIPDLRGQGESGGKGVTWGKKEPADLAGLLTTLQSRGVVTEERVGVIGVSYGAAMASLWAARDKRVEAAVLAAPYQRADTKIIDATGSFMGDIKLPFKMKKETLVKGTKIAAKRLNATWEELSPELAVTKIPKPVLFLASSGDEIIPQKEVETLHQKAPAGSKIHVFENLPHMILGLNFTGIEAVVVDWLKEIEFLEP